MSIFSKKEKKEKRAATKRQTSGFTVLIIPDSTDATKTTELTYDRLVKMFAGAIAVTIILVGLIVSMMYHNYRLKSTLSEAQNSITELKDVNARLGKTITSLDEQVKEDKEAFDKIEKTIDNKEREVNEAAIEAAIPAGIPIKSASSVLVTDPNEGKKAEGTNGVVFSTTAGAVVVATGTGRIESITDDVFYLKKVTINHGNGYKSVYRIPNDVTCNVGVEVKRNDMLAVLTEDGYVAYEITLNGELVDPKQVMVAE